MLADESRFLLVRQFRNPGGNFLDPVIFDFQRQQVGAGEIPVVVRLLFRSHGAGLAGPRVVQPRFLNDLAAVLENSDLPVRLAFDRLLDELCRVHVLDLAAGSEVVRA